MVEWKDGRYVDTEDAPPRDGEGPWCSEMRDGWVCTRDKDHDGLHAAHGGDATKPLATWAAAPADGAYDDGLTKQERRALERAEAILDEAGVGLCTIKSHQDVREITRGPAPAESGEVYCNSPLPHGPHDRCYGEGSKRVRPPAEGGEAGGATETIIRKQAWVLAGEIVNGVYSDQEEIAGAIGSTLAEFDERGFRAGQEASKTEAMKWFEETVSGELATLRSDLAAAKAREKRIQGLFVELAESSTKELEGQGRVFEAKLAAAERENQLLKRAVEHGRGKIGSEHLDALIAENATLFRELEAARGALEVERVCETCGIRVEPHRCGGANAEF